MRLFRRKPSYVEVMHEELIRKNRWLWNTLANDLYFDHPELWSWTKAKLEEYRRKFYGT